MQVYCALWSQKINCGEIRFVATHTALIPSVSQNRPSSYSNMKCPLLFCTATCFSSALQDLMNESFLFGVFQEVYSWLRLDLKNPGWPQGKALKSPQYPGRLVSLSMSRQTNKDLEQGRRPLKVLFYSW